MCGFAGECVFKGGGKADLRAAEAMAAAVARRGPDDYRTFVSADGRCAIAFHRLAVIDPAGSAQPLTLPGGPTVACNGEIYNYRQLREELSAAGAKFTTAGDVENIAHLFSRSEPAKMLQKLEGMFAVAIYDPRKGMLVLARDRLGQKPLCYKVLEDRVVFASTFDALLGHPSMDAVPDREAVTHYLTIGYVPSGYSAIAGLAKLPAGSFLAVSDRVSEPKRYWSPTAGRIGRAGGNPADDVREQLTASVAAHMVSDVPLGLLLSGGMDSSIIAAAMAQACGGGAVKTFTAGFADAEYDERPAAAQVARHLGTDHTELLIEPAAAGALETIVDLYDEPFGDSSGLALHLLCEAAREHVTVALTGDGGDEVFGGYDRYRAMWLGELMGLASYTLVRLAAAIARPFAPVHERSGLRRLIRFADGLPYPPAVQYFEYRKLFTPHELGLLLTDDAAGGMDLEGPMKWFCDLYAQGEELDLPDEVARSQWHDLMTYLPDDLLVKSDRASMACGLELRAPMLDHRLVELGLAIRAAGKFRRGGRTRGKAVLREAFVDALPPSVLGRRKQGFGIPLGAWLRTSLRETMKETLMDGWLSAGGMFNRDALAGLANDHLRGKDDHSHRLWALMVLGRWMDRKCKAES